MKIDKRTKEGKRLLDDIQFNTRYCNHKYEDRLRFVAEVTLDYSREARRLSGTCKSCYYQTGKFAGQAFTSYICEVCKVEHSHPNTACPKTCVKCAIDNKICRECMCILD